MRRLRHSPFAPLVAGGVVGTLILGVALAIAAVGELQRQHSGLTASIVGVYRYDLRSHTVYGAPSTEFSTSDDIAAEIVWSKLPASAQISAEWYDSSGDLIDESGPGPAGSAAEEAVMPSSDNSGPGWYGFYVELWSGGSRVETLDRTVVDLS